MPKVVKLAMTQMLQMVKMEEVAMMGAESVLERGERCRSISSSLPATVRPHTDVLLPFLCAQQAVKY